MNIKLWIKLRNPFHNMYSKNGIPAKPIETITKTIITHIFSTPG